MNLSAKAGISISSIKLATACLGFVALCSIVLYYVSIQSIRERTFQRDFDKDTTNNALAYRGAYLPQRGIIYNRVGKCGSRAIVQLVWDLSRDNRFKMISASNNGKGKTGSTLQQLQFVTFINQQTEPFFYTKHFDYINFERFGSVAPIHINLIRDPLSRMVSNYYFSRFGDGRTHKWKFNGSEKSRNMTFDECVLTERAECVGPYISYIIPFFCGQTRQCRKPSPWALKQALYNLTKRYLVVGILEEVDDFVKVLEKLLPEFFKGAWNKWKNPGLHREEMRNSTKTQNKKPPSEKVIKIMKRKLKTEYEFYEAAKRQFRALKLQLRIGTQVKRNASHPK